jgi:hypothetical protein
VFGWTGGESYVLEQIIKRSEKEGTKVSLSKRLFLATALVFVAGAFCALNAAPKIEFESDHINLGTVVSGDPITAAFKFTNKGDSELEITALRAGCGCTKSEAEKTKLAPGESSKITFVFNSTGFSGPVNKHITVSSNDPEHPNVSLSFEVEVVPIAKLKPERLNFGSIKVNQTKVHLLQVYPANPKNFAIQKIESMGEHVSAIGFKKVQSGSSEFWEVKVQVKAGPIPGRLMETLCIVAGSEPQKRLYAVVYGNVVE